MPSRTHRVETETSYFSILERPLLVGSHFTHLHPTDLLLSRAALPWRWGQQTHTHCCPCWIREISTTAWGCVCACVCTRVLFSFCLADGDCRSQAQRITFVFVCFLLLKLNKNNLHIWLLTLLRSVRSESTTHVHSHVYIWGQLLKN